MASKKEKPAAQCEAYAVLAVDCTISGNEIEAGSVVGGSALRVRQLIDGGMAAGTCQPSAAAVLLED